MYVCRYKSLKYGKKGKLFKPIKIVNEVKQQLILAEEKVMKISNHQCVIKWILYSVVALYNCLK